MTQTKPLNLAGLRPTTALIIVILSAIWMANPLSARAHVSGGIIPPFLCSGPGLVVQNLSVYATMPDANGQRQVTTSFQIVNQSALFATPSNTTVQLAAVSTVLLATPFLPSCATAFFATTTTTSATDFIITVTAGSNNTASYHFQASTPTLGRWRSIGPSKIVDSAGVPLGVGRVTTIAIDPTSPGSLYVGARASGLWKTTDGGAHWEPLTDALPTLKIDAVAVDSVNPTHVFIATPNGVFASRDGGHVWTQRYGGDLQGSGSDGGAFIASTIPLTATTAQASALSSGSTNSTSSGSPTTAQTSSPLTSSTTATTSGITTSAQVSFFPPFPTAFNIPVLYLTTANGLRFSLDGGFTWFTSLGACATVPNCPSSPTIESLDQDRSNPSHMLATVVNSPPIAGVYETFNGGLTPGSWHGLQGCPGAPAPQFSSQALAKAQIWVAQSGSTQWISEKVPDINGFGNLLGILHQLWRTTNQTCIVNGFPEHGWQLLSSGYNTPCIISNSQWSYLHADPTNPQIVYKAGVELCRSTDGGLTFTPMTGVLHHDHHVLVFHPAATATLFEGNDGGLYRSDDSGQSWAFDADGLAVTEFLDTDDGGASPRIVLGASQDNALSSTDLTTPVWQSIDLGPDGDGDRTTAAFDRVNSSVQYSIGQVVDHLDITQNGVTKSYNSGLPTGCSSYQDYLPILKTEFIATNSPNWHLLTTVGSLSIDPRDGPNCNGGLWGVPSTGSPSWQALFVPPVLPGATSGETLTRVTYDPSNGLFLAGGNLGSIYINFSPTSMAKVWNAPFGAVTAIVPDLFRAGNYFVSLSLVFGPGRIFEIGSSGAALQFNGQDITANLPQAMVLTLASNPFESGVLYAGTQGQGVFRGVRDSSGQWSWLAINNGMPEGANVTKLRVDSATGTIYASTLGRGEFALDTVLNTLF